MRLKTDSLKLFARDTSGAFAVWAALLTPALIGGAAFTVDASSLYNMDQDMQVAADALARAGASELDRRDDALTRATRAIQTLVTNEQKFGGSSRGTVRIAEIRFLETVPSQAHIKAPHSMTTQDPRKAEYVEVRLETERVSTIFPTDFVAGAMNIDMGAMSTARRTQSVCGVAPIFICNPYENDDTTDLYAAIETKAFQRRLVQFKRPTGQTKVKSGSSGDWGPGSFGYLEIPGANGASDMREAVGIDRPDFCMAEGGNVRLETGNINSMHFGFNVRFDMYDGPMKKHRSDTRYAPAANVIKGTDGVKVGCKALGKHDVALGMPRDLCHTLGTCTFGNNQIGNGDWDFVSYMARNHNFMTRVTIEGTIYNIDYATHSVSPAEPPSRYSVYRWEIDSDTIPGPKTYGKNSQSPEEGTPQCHTQGVSTADVDRRILYAAVLNCGEISATTGMKAGVDLPVETFVKVFLTEPVGSGSEPTIYGEIIGHVKEVSDSVSNEVAELTR